MITSHKSGIWIDTIFPSEKRMNLPCKGVDTVDFAKKLLGQIVFLYFLQKKGWFGVERNKGWGTGPKDFLRKLFDKKIIKYKNFFNDMLEPLFYEALASERTADYYSHFDCKIPFLNGGLFDPINNYDWVHTDILLPNDLFSNDIKTKEEDIGTGILDVFDRYNFTVKEDEPLEKEVAVDPEMLGKVFENLLEVKDRKSKGTYYTPREIVHYMCRESLINYIDTAVNRGEKSIASQKASQKKLLGKPDPEQLSLKTEQYNSIVPGKDIEFFIRQGESTIEHDSRVVKEKRETRDYSFQLPESIRKNAKLIDEKLADIKICDPAIGSGAFPVGMLHEIVSARKTLSVHMSKSNERTTYDFKRHAIHESLYGVDIDSSAVDIAKLRLWLSLVVDEEDFKTIKPLPNLDYKIVCGNSLLKVERDLFNDELFKELEALKEKFFDETNVKKKNKEKGNIEKLIKQITNNDEHFDFEVYFSEVFHQKGGFDVVIANPPYGIIYDKTFKDQVKILYPSFARNSDVYIAFYERGFNLIKINGTLIYISPNTFLNGDYFKAFRRTLTRCAIIHEIYDFKNLSVFEDPTVFVCTLSCKRVVDIDFPYDFQLKIANGHIDEYEPSNVIIDAPTTSSFKPIDKIFNKILNLQDVEITDNLFYVKDVGFNYWTKGKGKKRDGNSVGDRVFYLGDKKNKKDIPFIKGKDIFRYGCIAPNNYLKHNYCNFLDDMVDIFRFSAEFLRKKPKIIYRQTASKIVAALDVGGNFIDKTVHLIVQKPQAYQIDLKYLLALLNSKLFNYLYSYISQEKKGRVFAQVKATYIKQLPIKKVATEQKSFICLVDKILAITREDGYLENRTKQTKVKEYEQKIDKMVYKLYDLTPEEIKIVEKSVGK